MSRSRFASALCLLGVFTLSAASFGLGACDKTDEQLAVAGVQSACTLASVGTGVYVEIESNQGGAAAQKVSKNVDQDVSVACPALVTATQTAVNAITVSGGTATVTVSTSTPASAKRVIAKVRIRGVGAKRSLVYVVKPVSSGIPVVSDLINKLGSL